MENKVFSNITAIYCFHAIYLAVTESRCGFGRENVIICLEPSHMKSSVFLFYLCMDSSIISIAPTVNSSAIP